MSIRKKFILSHAAMIITPIIFIVLIMLLVSVVLMGNTEWNFGQSGVSSKEENIEFYQELVKTASLDQEKLSDPNYLTSISTQSNIVVRKGNELLYRSEEMNGILQKDLPAFGRDDFKPMGIWSNKNHYSIMQYDFYFKDGTEGSIFLLHQAPSFVKYARVFFPILFITLILSLVLTNFLLSYYMSRSILRPIEKLSTAAERISKGNFEFMLESHGKDELSKLIQTFESMRLQLKESFELRDKYENNRKVLIANISHDLKTPITSILGYVEGIEKGVANTIDKQKQYLGIIHSKASYMNKLIEELALYSKLDVNKEPFYFEPVNIREFVQDYVEHIEDDLHEKGVNLTFDGMFIDDKVQLDRNKVIRVLENIIYNSVKYFHNSTGEITVSLTNQERSVLITISDNGPGVPEKDLSTIFTRFYRVDSSRSQGGTGLGLAIAKQIIEAHGGSIWAENNNREGLNVFITLQKIEDGMNE
jgi:histidine kinase